MPLNARNTTQFSGVLRAGVDLRSIILYKRENDQRQGIVTTYKLFRCWRDEVRKTGQTLRDSLSVDESTTWHIPKFQLTRHGIAYLNATDIIYDPKEDRWFECYADDVITITLFGNIIDITTKQCDPFGLDVKR